MYKLRQPHSIPIILIYFTFIYSQLDPLAGRRALATSSNSRPQDKQYLQPIISTRTTEATTIPSTITSTTTTSDPIQIETGSSGPVKSKVVTDAFQNFFNLRQAPSDAITTSNTKFYVPRAMLEKYLESREDVRDFIPDDRDFLGKLDLQSVDEPHDKFWNEIYEKRGSYELPVDLSKPVGDNDYRERAEHMFVIPLERDPEDVAPSIEPQLPPHVDNVRNQKQYISVHLRFKLSQELASNEEELTQALLYLTRDGLDGCLFQPCERKPISFFKSTRDKSNIVNQTSITHNSHNTSSDVTKDRGSNVIASIVPQYQRVFILLVSGYDQFNEPITRIIANERIFTRQTGAIQFDLTDAVRIWIKDPKANHGIIIRVRNDDENFERQQALRRKSSHKGNIKRETGSMTSANPTENEETEATMPEASFLEQVRLKRGFGQKSDDDETWCRKKPYIMGWTKRKELPEQERFGRHVGSEEDDTEGMQADDPNVLGAQQTSTSTESSYIQTTVNGRDSALQTDKPFNADSQASLYESIAKRDHIPTYNSTRNRGQQSSRAPGVGRPSSPQQGNSGHRSKGKGKASLRQSDKSCSKKTLKINFDEVGWSSWIIAPHSYYANYCSGECTWPLADTQNATNHAIIQAIYESVGRVVPKSCCAPVKLARMAILYQVDGVVQMRQYDDMIIDACGCL